MDTKPGVYETWSGALRRLGRALAGGAIFWTVLLLAGCGPQGGFEAVESPDGDALAIFPAGGFYNPEAACTEYVEFLDQQNEKDGVEGRAYRCRAR